MKVANVGNLSRTVVLEVILFSHLAAILENTYFLFRSLSYSVEHCLFIQLERAEM